MSDTNNVQELPVDRGDTYVPPEPAKVELTDEDLTTIGRAPEKAEAAEPGKVEEKSEEKAEEKVEDKGEKKPIMIPKARFDELNNKAKARVAALEAQLEALKTKSESNPQAVEVSALETELDTKSAEYGVLVADGKLDDAAKLMKEISKLNRKIGLAEAAALTNTHSQETRQMDSLENLVSMYKEAFPVFDDANKDEYKQEYVDFVAKLQGGYEAAGDTAAEALRQAVEIAVLKFGLTAADEPAKEPEPKKDKGQERKGAAIDKALKAAGAQPPDMKKVGADSDKIGMSKIDVESLSMDEFMALPESTLKRLRGDIA